MNRDGSGARVVTGDFDRDVDAPRWSPDGSAIWFLADERGNTGIWRTDLRGKVERVAGNVGSSHFGVRRRRRVHASRATAPTP